MEAVLGTSVVVFVIFTVVIVGGAAFMAGQAVAATWRPVWEVFFYCFLLGLTDRFLIWGIFQGELLSLSGFVVDTAVLLAIALFAYRTTHVSKMVSQYPWLYERAGPWSYRRKTSPAGREPPEDA
ncbi:MAG: hypothetical protein V3T93_00985 [Alphaproteobacteria bacterium]